MTDPHLRIVAIVLLSVCLGMMATGIVLGFITSTVAFLDVVAMLPLPVLGALLTIKKPRHPIGWLMLMVATAVGGATLSHTVGQLEGIGGFGAGVAQVSNHISFAIMVGGFGLMLALFPTGSVASPRWRLLRWTPVVSTFLLALNALFVAADDPLEARSPFAIDAATPFFEAAGGVGLVMGFLSIVAGGLSVVVRARTAGATERAQIKWFAFGVGALVALMLVSVTPWTRGPRISAVFEVLLLLMVGVVLPGCLALAILKHRLYDIDVVVNRALVYTALTAILATSYLLIVVILQRLLEPLTAQSDLAVAASTLAVAALFRPLRSRVQAFIDHRFYRRKYDAAETLSAFSGRLRDQVDLASLRIELVGVVEDTMQPAYASLWLRRTGGER